MPAFALGVIKQDGVIFAHIEQRLPFHPLRLASSDFFIETRVNMSDRYTILRLGDELALFPKQFLEVLDLIQKFDDLTANGTDRPHHLKPCLGAFLSARLYFVEIQYFVLEIEIDFVLEESLEVLSVHH